MFLQEHFINYTDYSVEWHDGYEWLSEKSEEGRCRGLLKHLNICSDRLKKMTKNST